MEKMTKEQANKKVSENLEKAKTLLSECYELANQYGLDFRTPITEYGMGGYYHGKGRDEFERSEEKDEWYYSNEGWRASSTSC